MDTAASTAASTPSTDARDPALQPGRVIVLSGPPASGKGTQCKLLAAELGFVHLSTGDIFRDAVARGTELGLQAKPYIEKGLFVPDEMVVSFIKSRLAQPDVQARGCLLDGFPRTAEQAAHLTAEVQVDRFILLQVPDKALIARAAGRRIDPQNGEIYNTTYMPPPTDPAVVQRLVQRKYDDDSTTFKVRLDTFHMQIRRILPVFTAAASGQVAACVWTVDGMRPHQEVFADLSRCLRPSTIAVPAAAAAAAAGAGGGGGAADARSAAAASPAALAAAALVAAAAAAAVPTPKDVPRSFRCPVTLEVMADPVSTCDGHTYERAAIEQWLSSHSTSPQTGAALATKTLTPAWALRHAIEEWADGNGAIDPAEAAAAAQAAVAAAAAAEEAAAVDAAATAALLAPRRNVDDLLDAGGAASASAASATATGIGTVSDLAGADAGGARSEVVAYDEWPEDEDGSGVDQAQIKITIAPASPLIEDTTTSDATNFDLSDVQPVVISVDVADAVERVPTDVCCVVDVSGSMGSLATYEGEDGLVQNDGLNILDLVKHAVKCIAHILGPEDRLSVVAFANRATTIFKPKLMTEQGRAKAVVDLELLHPNGRTNIWDGLLHGMDALRTPDDLDGLAVHRRKTLLLLTDGQPNISPPDGHVAELRNYQEKYPDFKFQLNTFGFGYNLDSKLLADLAQEGNGTYAFIPDAVILGTTFVNSIANVMSTHTQNAQMTLVAKGGASFAPSATTGHGVAGSYEHTCDSWGHTVHLGSLNYGQTRDVAVAMQVPVGAVDPDAIYLEVVVTYDNLDGSTSKVTGHGSSRSPTVDALAAVLRSDAVDTGIAAVVDAESQRGRAAIASVDQLLLRVTEAASQSNNDGRIAALKADVEGRMAKALTGKDRFNRWGKHYLRALVRSHQVQACTNFMDPGLQVYGGTLFRTVRDQGDAVFLSLPAPTPASVGRRMSLSRPVIPVTAGTAAPPQFGAASTATTPAYVNRTPAPDMRTYYAGSGGGCFGGASTVMVASAEHAHNNGGGAAFARTKVKNVKPGMYLMVADGTTACVRFVVRIARDAQKLLCKLPSGLAITARHPIRVDGVWTLPGELPEAARVETGAEACVYNVVLDSNHVLVVDGVECITWGHTFMEDSRVAHPYYGSASVVRDLEKVALTDGIADGVVSVRGSLKDAAGNVVGLLGNTPLQAAAGLGAEARCGAGASLNGHVVQHLMAV